LEELLAEIHAFCAAHADPQVAARYFKEGHDPYGVMGDWRTSPAKYRRAVPVAITPRRR
jgi:hypothetical protein